ncbi:hypothetical protein Hypma_002080 [Hypsizygus marmoreus]|uniref:Uncharacterized protein n=1 Tax=Hypsizygus marmoreus TaxID=39966 RepID=A0A369JZT7_HYPMA|nr:hypothetical protein Hypma_002080 [Hypsizygus marmoreus]
MKLLGCSKSFRLRLYFLAPDAQQWKPSKWTTDPSRIGPTLSTLVPLTPSPNDVLNPSTAREVFCTGFSRRSERHMSLSPGRGFCCEAVRSTMIVLYG